MSELIVKDMINFQFQIQFLEVKIQENSLI